MEKFIVVFLSMIVTLLFTNYLISSKNTESKKEDITLNFDNEKIKCKCDMPDDVKEKFTNYTKEPELQINAVPIDSNLVTSIDDLQEPTRNNLTAELYFEKYFKYPLEPIEEAESIVNSVNEYKYLNIGNDMDKVIKNIKTI